MLGLPAAATRVGNQSSPEVMPFSTLPAGTLPGQGRIMGARKPPSITVPFPPANGVWPPSGQVKFSVPLSVVKPMMVSPSTPRSFTFFIPAPTMSSIWAMPASEMDQPFSGVRVFWYFSDRGVHARGIEPDEERFAILLRLVYERKRMSQDLVIDG